MKLFYWIENVKPTIPNLFNTSVPGIFVLSNMAFFVPVSRLAILEQKVFWCYLMYMYMYVERRVQNVYIILLFGKHNLKKTDFDTWPNHFWLGRII